MSNCEYNFEASVARRNPSQFTISSSLGLVNPAIDTRLRHLVTPKDTVGRRIVARTKGPLSLSLANG